MTKKDKDFDGICCICRGPIAVEAGTWKYGHNSDPVDLGHHRCCRECNDNVVIPLRLAHTFRRSYISHFADKNPAR